MVDSYRVDEGTLEVVVVAFWTSLVDEDLFGGGLAAFGFSLA
ncbi:hypothetical protein [Bacillus sp. HNG]|nr:hypothetical protein [Bacillus sp. HNG]